MFGTGLCDGSPCGTETQRQVLDWREGGLPAEVSFDIHEWLPGQTRSSRDGQAQCVTGRSRLFTLDVRERRSVQVASANQSQQRRARDRGEDKPFTLSRQASQQASEEERKRWEMRLQRLRLSWVEVLALVPWVLRKEHGLENAPMVLVLP